MMGGGIGGTGINNGWSNKTGRGVLPPPPRHPNQLKEVKL